MTSPGPLLRLSEGCHAGAGGDVVSSEGPWGRFHLGACVVVGRR